VNLVLEKTATVCLLWDRGEEMASSHIPNEQQQTAARVALGVLDAVDGGRAVTQRRIAADLGIAVIECEGLL
jgi:hypothetical protein